MDDINRYKAIKLLQKRKRDIHKILTGNKTVFCGMDINDLGGLSNSGTIMLNEELNDIVFMLDNNLSEECLNIIQNKTWSFSVYYAINVALGKHEDIDNYESLLTNRCNIKLFQIILE
jgi:hypothetical protein